ncbi:nucleotide sugar dehydrogenase [Staphylococcus xylosus]|uniref:nucleotide sugar dehydrogenase n=1 Tax=Staphylococcus xylosus TaxID=1288 RepID=UPI002DBF33B4|nr:nucleotide sugar dehydrogenase [Staphylococcus xylosus]MEB7822007.1 nucleotide sugar dehydrogenase [Staphylococcus xylosus]MEB8187606.1 nucleotide sugar dehydrogenase [Staphylococcus xylosus]
MEKNKMTIAVIGLGYVGMPLAIAFSEKFETIGYDIDDAKINKYKNNIDPTGEVGEEVLRETSLKFTSNADELEKANFYIVTVPTPIKQDNTPNLSPIKGATRLIGDYLKKGDTVVYESTVYPGVTEDVCVPLLEEISSLKIKEDFKVGYSPERINPGDKKNTVKKIIKIVSGIDEESLELIGGVYGEAIPAGVHKAPNIKVAESAKVVENSQRDINIAFMNELSQVFDLMDINTNDVIDAMNTKWNALGFYPGLVGGHCIGVDPYYFIYQAENVGYHSQIIASGRKINNYMSKFVVTNIIKELIKNNLMQNASIVIYGLTFKENTPDFRNSKIINIVEELNEYGIRPIVVDPYIKEFSGNIDADIHSDVNEISEVDLMLYAVDHKEFKLIEDSEFLNKLNDKKAIIVDLKNRFKQYQNANKVYWSL